MATERGLAMATCTAPVNIAVIKYCACRGTRAGAGLAPAKGARIPSRTACVASVCAVPGDTVPGQETQAVLRCVPACRAIPGCAMPCHAIPIHAIKLFHAIPSRAMPCSLAGGKRDTDLILPINSSLSVTLHQDQVGQHQHQDQV